ncbi:VWA domain-containing protein [Catellatospora citrea]|uniref:VWA domain-containing protein n=1 Tax=Catellatospora citrea TaxID=53366 RepID=UPI0034101E7D
MSLAWPWALAALLVIPLLLVVRWWLNRRRRKVAVRVSSIALIRAALPGRSRWQRRIPAALFVLGLLALGLAVARPQASLAVPQDSTAILLAMDVSQSMCSTDVPPNRLTAAREAAREFVLAQEDGTRIGLVAFSGISGLLVEPTDDKQALLTAIDGLRTSRGTAIGQAILTSIDAIAEINPAVPPTGVELGEPGSPGSGEYVADTIVVLTDGANTQGVDPVTAAQEAKARGLRVYTIGFGTTEPAPLICSADQMTAGSGARPEWQGRGGGGRRAQLIDEDTLGEVAELTGGEYFRAQDAEQLVGVLTDLPSTIVTQKQDVEMTVWFVLAGALLAGTGVGLSLRWNRS